MEYEDKFQVAMEELKKANISKNMRPPPVVRVLRKLGLKARPPHYNSFATNFLTNGVLFFIGWGAIMYFILWRPQNYPIAICILSSAGAGILFGLTMAYLLKRTASKNSLTPWDKIGNA